MLKYVVFLLFLYGVKNASSDSSNSRERAVESKESPKIGIKKNEVGANGIEANWEIVTRNFRNPVLEYLLQKNSDRTVEPPRRGVIREIQHRQTLLVPNFLGGALPQLLVNQLPQFETQKKPVEQETRNPDSLPFDNFWNYLKNKTQSGGSKLQEKVVSSPVLHLNKNPEVKPESTRIQVYPAVAVVINTFDKDGSLKNSVTHFQPDFNLLGGPQASERGATHVTGEKNENYKNNYGGHHTVSNYVRGAPGHGPRQDLAPRQGISWPFAGYFPIVINDPFLSVYNAFATSMYNAVSTMIEYGPEADICQKERGRTAESEYAERAEVKQQQEARPSKLKIFDRYQTDTTDTNVFDEITMQSDSYKRTNRRPFVRERRDTTSIFVKSREGDTVNVTLQEPTGSKAVALNVPDERARSFGPSLVNTPPLSTILRPPQQESRQFLGYADKKKRAKPSKPMKEEGSSEEVGEEHEEENTSQSQESANEAVAISPPPEGASVAEAKPIGLAIAGPGGVAASKPQGTAVAGPGGLAIARPVGTAIAGVEVEGSVPIGGQQKNKKKPKQEQEQTEAELHYVGGLTGPIGNPQPKEFADSIYYKTVKETEGNGLQENLFFRGRPNANGLHLKLGQQNGKYGFVPTFADPAVRGGGRPQKREDFPIFFHGLLGNNAQGFDQFQNFQTQF